MARQVNRMSHAEHYKLCQWLQQQTLTSDCTLESLAVTAAAALSLPITRSHIATSLETLELEIPAKCPKTADDRIVVVAAVLVDLLVDLGRPIPKELSSLFKK